jgi:hypothetical protein
MLAPGQSWPPEGTQPGSLNATATGTAAASATSGSSTSHSHKLSGGAIAGIAIAAAAVVLLGAALCYFVGRSNSYAHIIKHQQKSDGTPSQVGDKHLGPWSPAPQSPSAPAGWDHRFSGGTQASQGTFVGYNRMTGAPEFASEAPTEGGLSEKGRPIPGHPAFGPGSQQETTYELPGEQPPVAEVGPYK